MIKDENKALTPAQRDMLFNKIREESDFRELLKQDWREAVKQIDIDADELTRELRREDERFSASPLSRVFVIIDANKDIHDFERPELIEAIDFETRN